MEKKFKQKYIYKNFIKILKSNFRFSENSLEN